MIELIVLEGLSPWDDGTPAINVQYLRDGKLITGHYRPATKAQIDAAASPQMQEDAACISALMNAPIGTGIYKVSTGYLVDVKDEQYSWMGKRYRGATPAAALRAAGLLPPA